MVSVVIPSYNSMSFLPETLNSVLNQTFTDFEVLIINDGSTDNIVDWVAEIKDPRVRLISQANQGLSQARNAGILNSRGLYIAFLDADDLWEPTKLEKQVAAFKDNPYLGLVHTYVSMVDANNNYLYIIGSRHEKGNILRRVIEQNPVISGSSSMVHRDCFEKVGLFDKDLKSAEDWHMWSRIAVSYPMMVIEEPLVRYRQHPTSMSKDWQRMSRELNSAIEKIFEYVPGDLVWIKSQTLARAHLQLAQISRTAGNYKQSLYSCLRAFSSNPKICFNYDYLRLVVKNLLGVA